MMKLKSLDMKYSKSVLFRLLELKEAFQKDLSPIVKNWAMLKQVLNALEKDGLIKITESTKGKKQYKIKLTEKGRIVTEQLKEVDRTAKLSSEELERFKNLRALIHLNIYEDHITIRDIHMGESRIVDVYVKLKGNTVYFYCDMHQSDDCYHIQYMFHDVEISDFIRKWINKNGYKLAKKYQKYVEEYW